MLPTSADLRIRLKPGRVDERTVMALTRQPESLQGVERCHSYLESAGAAHP